MKKIIYYTGCFACMLLMASCSDDVKNAIDTPLPISPVATQTTDGALKYMEFTASTGADTRTQLTDDNKVVWVSGDAISIFDGTANRQFTTKDNGASAVFGGEAKSVETYYALYPYQAGATIENNVIKNLSIPVVQEAKAGSFDGGVNISVASASNDLQLAFKNVGSLVKFSMTNDKAADVRRVKLTSNDGTAILAGTVNITVGATPTVTATSSQSQVTLKSDTGFEKDKDYYFMVLPGTLSDGFSLTFTDKDNLTWQKTYTTEATMNRSNILRLNDIELGTFTTGLLTNVNLIAAAEASSGQSFTKNVDGTVSLMNPTNLQLVQSIDSLNLNGKNDPTICDEIHFFTGLKVLECSGNTIENLDVSANLALEELYCTGTSYESYIDNRGFEQYKFQGLKLLDVSKNSALKVLYISNNQLKSLDLSNNSELEALYADRNGLVSVDVSKCLKLKKLSLWINNLTSLDVSNNSMLDYLVCSQNEISSLDVTQNSLLRQLWSGANNFTSLDVSKNTQLTLLSCDWSLLTEIDLSNNGDLKTFNCYNSKIKTLDLSHNTKLLDLHCGSCQLSDLNVSNNLKLEKLQCYDNKLASLDLSMNTKLNYLICFMNQLTTLDISNTKIYLGCGFGNQKDNVGNELLITLFVNSDQFNQELTHDNWSYTNPYVDDVNINVNVVLKSTATHEGYNESNYGN